MKKHNCIEPEEQDIQTMEQILHNFRILTVFKTLSGLPDGKSIHDQVENQIDEQRRSDKRS